MARLIGQESELPRGRLALEGKSHESSLTIKPIVMAFIHRQLCYPVQLTKHSINGIIFKKKLLR